MNNYKDLEDSLYELVIGLFPTWTVIFAYTNGPEPTTSYCVIDVQKLKPVGQQYTSHLTEVDPPSGIGSTQTVQDMLASVRFEFHGKYDDNTITAEMAHQLESAMRTPKSFELMKLNRLALHKGMTARRVRDRRETEVYMAYQLDCTFAYSSMTSEEIDWIEVVRMGATYRDAGREPDHVIHNELEINTTPNP